MVGYNKNRLIDFLSILDSYNIDSVVTKTKVRASFYKLIMADIDQIEVYKKEVTSILLMMAVIYSKKNSRNEKKSYSTIASEITLHELNRSLYGQQRLSSIMSKPSDVPVIQLLAMDSISNSKFIDVIAMLMISFNSDLEDLFSEEGLVRKMIENNLFLGDSFATIEEIADATDSYNA